MSEHADRRSADEPATVDLTPSSPAPRRTDGQRWQAAWERFSAMSDGDDASAGQPGGAEPTVATEPPVASRAGRTELPSQPAAPSPPAAPSQPAAPFPAVDPAPPVAESAGSAAPAAPDSADPASPAAAARSLSAADLASAILQRPREDAPGRGWRRLVHRVTAGAVNPGLSTAEQQRAQLLRRVRTPLHGRHRIAVVSLKGGIGKTTTAACLGLTLSQHRGDRVVAVDANPDAGTLAERLTGDATVTVHDLLADIADIASYTDVSAYTYLAGRLQVLASGQDPEASQAFDEDQYRAVVEVLQRYFDILITDSGTGLLHSAMAGTLAAADSLVVVGAPSVDGATRAAKTLDWLVAHGYGDLVRRSVAVISSVRPVTRASDPAPVQEHFAERCRTVVEIPYDPHLVTGGRIAMSELRRPTGEAFLTLAAAVADGFALSQ